MWQGGLPENKPTEIPETRNGLYKKALESSASSLCFTCSVLTKNDDSLHTEGRIGDRPCLVTIDTRASVTIARLDITSDLPKFCRLRQGRPCLSWKRCCYSWLWDEERYVSGCSSQRSQTNLSWGWMSCEPMTLQWFEALCAMNGQRSSVIMASQDATVIISPYGDQWQCSTC
jgi:hypothetical protein